MLDFIADGMELPPAVAGHQHEIIELRRRAAHVEHDDILAAVVVGGACCRQGQLQAAPASSFGRGGGVCDGDVQLGVLNGGVQISVQFYLHMCWPTRGCPTNPIAAVCGPSKMRPVCDALE